MAGRRSNIEIIADILRMREASKTQVMYRVGMSYSQLQKYLDYLVERGFLVRGFEKYPGGIYRISEEGNQLLNSIEKIEEILTFDKGEARPGRIENVSQSLVGLQANA